MAERRLLVPPTRGVGRPRRFLPVPAAAPAPTTPPVAGYIGWWDASDTSSITGGAAVSAWNDKSANAYHLTQGTAGNKPSSGTRTLNGLNVIDFDGIDDFLARATTPALDTTMTLCAVFIADAPATTSYVVMSADNASYVFGLMNTADSKWTAFSGAFGAAGAANSAGVAAQVTTKFNGASSVTYKDGSAGSGYTAAQTATGLSIGASVAAALPTNGAYAEMVLYDTALNDSDRGLTETYLKAKWGTA